MAYQDLKIKTVERREEPALLSGLPSKSDLDKVYSAKKINFFAHLEAQISDHGSNSIWIIFSWYAHSYFLVAFSDRLLSLCVHTILLLL